MVLQEGFNLQIRQ